MTKLTFAGTIFASAFLLFLVQPIVSKNILPWFGGSAGVWAICMVFFQVVLLLGYAYADWTTRRLQPRSQVILHAVLLAASLACLPVVAGPAWKPDGAASPAAWILLLLVSTVGLPYFLLSTTGPLIQSWVSHTLASAKVYRYFSLSNLASLAALVCYPFFIEPRAPLLQQAHVWSGVYVAFALLCIASGVVFARRTPAPDGPATTSEDDQAAAPRPRQCLLWIALAAMGSWTLLAVTNHITQNVAAIPFLWLLPLTVYLLTFVLCFESERWYSRRWFALPAAVLLGLCAYGLRSLKLGYDIRVAIPLYVSGLFFLCMFLHGELAAMKPGLRYLTRFYLMVSLGGALGGIAVGLVAPHVLPAYYELGIGFAVIALLALLVLRTSRLYLAGSALLLVLCGAFLYGQVSENNEGALLLTRNFYGALRVSDASRGSPPVVVRQLYHGSIRHGEQYLNPARRREPTTYYGPASGVGLALSNTRSEGKKVGLIGLGAGTLAAYGKAGDVYRFYEINPQVVEIAERQFSFLRDSPAKIEIALGDARLLLEQEAPQGFDVLAVDAFSGDSIPVHLITREAMAIYRRHLSERGIIAFHVSNRFLSLAPVVARLAADQGMWVVRVHDNAKTTTQHSSEWVLVAQDRSVLAQGPIARAAGPIPVIPGLRVWTDDFNNLWQITK